MSKTNKPRVKTGDFFDLIFFWGEQPDTFPLMLEFLEISFPLKAPKAQFSFALTSLCIGFTFICDPV